MVDKFKFMQQRRHLIKNILLAICLETIRSWLTGIKLFAAKKPKKLVRPSCFLSPEHPEFAVRSHIYSVRFAGPQPQFIAAVKSEHDLIHTIRFARQEKIPIAIKAGGHSYIGQSTGTGILIELSQLNHIEVDKDQQLLKTEGGALQLNVAQAAAKHGVALPFGTCPKVGIAGYALGGGLGPMKRAWSALSDRLVSARLVDAEGKVIVCSATEHPDLLWALRGGGRCSFGVITSLSFKTESCTQLHFYKLSFNWQDGPIILNAWFHWLELLPDAIGSRLELGTGPDGSRVLQIYGNALVSKAVLIEYLTKLPKPAQQEIFEEDYFANVLRWAGCETYQACSKQSGLISELAEASFSAKSRFVKAIPSQDILKQCLDIFDKPPTVKPFFWACMLIDAAGGVINRYPAADSAFVHRDSKAMIQYLVYFDQKDAGIENSSMTWLNQLYQAWPPHETEAYQNYADAQLKTWEEDYYGANRDRLKAIKNRYDPTGTFNGLQII